ncbi:MAG: YbaB/EbfC family nucleoid-associated protein [Chitinophagales bacterium]|nr:YbaB/EbfC family nucleoid-associated protein [Chitinophagales bacterium]MDW8273441.1 YbaB/EbfC family nucleoid-associated protein [Chitinophagales bacterium]
MGFFDQLKQLNEMKQKMEDIKKKLDVMEISAENEYVKVTVGGNRRIKKIELIKEPSSGYPTEYIQLATNEALDKAENLLQTEFAALTKGMFPHLPF